MLLPAGKGSKETRVLSNDVNKSVMTLKDHYASFYAALTDLRERLHSVGQFDDANSKLDELCKLFALRALDIRKNNTCDVQWLTHRHLERTAEKQYGDKTQLSRVLPSVILALQESFERESSEIQSTFSLDYDAIDDNFVAAILPVLEAMPHPNVGSPDSEESTWSFDIINEAFGHFIQNSFRNRKEDAQYMTPPEVVSAMVQMSLHDVHKIAYADRQLIIGDPTCGVGSFLAASYRHLSLRQDGLNHSSIRLIGQDRVNRMVRLARTNLTVFADALAEVTSGNSILTGSPLDELTGQMDFILTNPPFGAVFSREDLFRGRSRKDYPTLNALAGKGTLPLRLDSEYVLLDRSLALLKPHGLVWIIVPDRLVSGSGFPETFRRQVLKLARLRAVIDLPVETFAQAGTRTKTSIVCLQNLDAERMGPDRKPVFMATCDDIGFRVTTRGGVNVKQIDGTNQLTEIIDEYLHTWPSWETNQRFCSLRDTPSVTLVREDHLLNDRWNAHFYRSSRLSAISEIRQIASDLDNTAIQRLDKIVTIDPDSSQRIDGTNDNRCISVLHVDELGLVRINAVDKYKPTTPCARCRPGDVLFSRINPRIPRICVTPDLGKSFGCSTEFAVLRCRQDSPFTPWMLALMLRNNLVQRQILSLTSGTSSSHNRIKPRELASVLLPVYQPKTNAYEQLRQVAEKYRQGANLQYQAASSITQCFDVANTLFRAGR